MEPPETETQSTKQGPFTVLGLIAGGVLGYPLSYYFQPGALREKISLGEYIKHFSEIVGDKDLQSAVILGFVVAVIACMAAGFLIGRALDQKK